ncbi:TPM domain-containing protein [Pseudotabrizicola formosa]|uniref:TPM domain-containing protein n=1 Tax=Pseudotabrizicola formosa TaxID=2030009 RepID=UPI00143D8C68|nr:TPM domain-containing protein [Pseudotabrizicola formosa]
MLRAVLLILALLAPAASLAQSLPDPLSDTVSDFAGILPPEVAVQLTDTLAAGRAETGVQVVLVTMARISDHGGAGQRIEDYAKALFNHWGIGDATRDDGILLLVAVEDRSMRIALGAGYPVIWDNAAQRVIDRHVLPDFREGDYIGGLQAGIPATFDLIARPFAAGVTPPPDPASRWQDLAPFAIFAAIAAAMIGLAARRRLGDALVRLRTCPRCGRRSLRRLREILTAPTAQSAGQGLTHTQCSACGWDRTEPVTLPRRAASKGSGGGFGGGSSSGGGATGRW